MPKHPISDAEPTDPRLAFLVNEAVKSMEAGGGYRAAMYIRAANDWIQGRSNDSLECCLEDFPGSRGPRPPKDAGRIAALEEARRRVRDVAEFFGLGIAATDIMVSKLEILWSGTVNQNPQQPTPCTSSH